MTESIHGLKDHEIRELTNSIVKTLRLFLHNKRCKVLPNSYIGEMDKLDQLYHSSAVIMLPESLRDMVSRGIIDYLQRNNLNLDKHDKI